MSKAILVIDMPRSCCFCDFCKTEPYDPWKQIDGDRYCAIEDLHSNVDKYFDAAFQEEYIKPDWCPLKELPGEKENYTFNNYDYGWVDGWNDCLKEILGE